MSFPPRPPRLSQLGLAHLRVLLGAQERGTVDGFGGRCEAARAHLKRCGQLVHGEVETGHRLAGRAGAMALEGKLQRKAK